MHEIGDPYFSEIASGVLSLAAEHGRTVQICHTGRDPEAEVDQVRSLVANRVGAILIAASGLLPVGAYVVSALLLVAIVVVLETDAARRGLSAQPARTI